MTNELPLIAVTLLISFTTLLLLLPIYRHVHINLLDEGFMAYPAWLIYKGKKPYKDFYLGYTPARATLLAFLFRLFGSTLQVARIYYLFLTTLLASEVVLFSYLFVPVLFLSFFAGIIFLVAMIPRRDIYYITLLETGMFSDKTIWAILFMMSFIISWKTGVPSFFFLSGMLLGLTFLWGQETCIWALISTSLF